MASIRSKRSIQLSQSESRMLALIPGRGRRVTTEWLARRYYGFDPPYHARTIVAGILRSLERKTKLMRAKRRVKRSGRAGPHPIEVWLQ